MQASSAMDPNQTADIEAQNTQAGKDDASKTEDTVPSTMPADGQSNKRVRSTSAAPEQMAETDSRNADDSAEVDDDPIHLKYVLLAMQYANKERPAFVFPKWMARVNILQLQEELLKTHENMFNARSAEKDRELMTQVEDQLHRYSKAYH